MENIENLSIEQLEHLIKFCNEELIKTEKKANEIRERIELYHQTKVKKDKNKK